MAKKFKDLTQKEKNQLYIRLFFLFGVKNDIETKSNNFIKGINFIHRKYNPVKNTTTFKVEMEFQNPEMFRNIIEIDELYKEQEIIE